MTSPRDSSSPRASIWTVCLTCGDKGNTDLLIYCRKCRESAVHHYCMDNHSPSDDNIRWRCWDCAPEDISNKPLRRSGLICPKKRKVLKTGIFWEGRFNQNQEVVQNSTEVNEIAQTPNGRHSSIRDADSESLNERQMDPEVLEEKKLISHQTPSHSKEHSESIEINEPSTLPIQDKNNTQSLDGDGTQKTHQMPSLVANTHFISPQTLSSQPSLEPDDGILAEPDVDPKWRGWFNINEEEDETFEILAHLSNKACLKVSDAATDMPHTLDIQILDKHAVWPTRFMVTPPTTASIALYFFPACDRDERMYDSILDEVIEKELALKAIISNVELLIFSSYELPLQHRRFNGKYFFWGVFRQKQRSHSPAQTTASASPQNDSNNSGHCEPNLVLAYSKTGDGLNSPSHPNLSPLSMNSSQASNLPPSKHNTPESRVCPTASQWSLNTQKASADE